MDDVGEARDVPKHERVHGKSLKRRVITPHVIFELDKFSPSLYYMTTPRESLQRISRNMLTYRETDNKEILQ